MHDQKQPLSALIAERALREERQESVRARRPKGLLAFMRAAWPLVVPNAPFVAGWHIEAICAHLEAQSRGDLPRLVINVPPGSSKSTTVCVMWCAWEWTWNPGCQWQYGAYGETLAVRDSLRSRALMTSEWYRELWGDVWEPKKNGWLIDSLENDKGGSRQAISVGGAPTGFHAHRQVVDDPLKALDAHSAPARERARVWWEQAMASRMLPGDNTRTIIMQRLHDADLAAQAKEQGYAVLSIPMVYSIAARRAATPIGWTDPRTRDGELLCPARWDAVEVARRKREFGPDGWAAQDQQDPVPEGGAIYHEAWLAQFYQARPELHGMQVIQSVDCAFKSHETSSYVCAQVWAYKPPNFWLLDEIRDHLDFLATVAAVKTLRARWPSTTAILIEDKANGPAVINSLSKVPGVLAIEPMGSKIARAYATQPVFAAGNVWLPDPSLCPWIFDWVTEHKRFPSGVANDRVDAQTQAITYFVQGGAAEYMAALDAV